MTDPHVPSSRTGGIAKVGLGGLQIMIVIGVLIGAVIVNRALMSADRGPTRAEASAAAPAVAVLRPTATTAVLTVSETGTVQARTTVSLAPQVSGRVTAVSENLAAGGAFSAGEALFEIDPTDARLSAQQAAADLANAEAALELERAEAQTARREWDLVNPGEPIPDLVAREPQIARAQASVDSAAARLATANTALGRTTYALPFDGRVLTSRIEVGQTLTANQPYGDVYRLDALEIVVPVSAEDLARLSPAVGRSARVSGPNGRGALQGAVTRVDAALDSATRLASVTIGFSSPPPLLPGAFVDVAITGDTATGVFRLPADVLGAGDRVWIADDDALKAVTVRVLGRQGDAIIVTAFDAGQGVVTTPPPGAHDGLAIEIVEARS